MLCVGLVPLRARPRHGENGVVPRPVAEAIGRPPRHCRRWRAGITDRHFIPPQARRQFFEITFGLQRRLIANHAKIAKARLGEELIRQTDQALACAKNGHEQDFSSQTVTGGASQRRPDAMGFGFQRPRCLVNSIKPIWPNARRKVSMSVSTFLAWPIGLDQRVLKDSAAFHGYSA